MTLKRCEATVLAQLQYLTLRSVSEAAGVSHEIVRRLRHGGSASENTVALVTKAVAALTADKSEAELREMYRKRTTRYGTPQQTRRAVSEKTMEALRSMSAAEASRLSNVSREVVMQVKDGIFPSRRVALVLEAYFDPQPRKE